jgi:acylphosphatase
MAGETTVTRRLLIHGRVQGVGYRESLRAAAVARGLTGWVRNRADGTVEAVVQGSPDDVGAVVAWAQRGPPLARVERVELADATGEFHTFERRSSA